jgi:hypothetical protein
VSWQPILLIAFGGFMVGGTAAMWKTSKVAAVVCALIALACLAGGVVWLVG